MKRFKNIGAITLIALIIAIYCGYIFLTNRTNDIYFDTSINTTQASLLDITNVGVNYIAAEENNDLTELEDELKTWISANSGEYMIALREIGGKNRTLDINSDRKSVTASTYKIFVAYSVYLLEEIGQLSTTEVLGSGQTIERCVERSIVESDNDCAKELGFRIGWQTATDYMQELGLSSIDINNFNVDGSYNGNKWASAKDEADFLVLLEKGSLLNTQHTEKLLTYMKFQQHRYGIPEGSADSTVANKPGWLNDVYYHDAGLVYGSRSTYALVIMTENTGGWSSISTLSALINSYMNDM